jgi:hypothetical protein
MTIHDSRTNHGDVASVIDLFVTALGGRDAVDAAVAQTITAEGWRRHPAWGTDPGKAEAVATFGYTLVEDAVRPRYRLSLSAHTFLVPAELQYTEIGNGSVGHVTGIDFMFDPRPVDLAIESWRVTTRLRHFDLTSPLRLARKLTLPGADVSLDEAATDAEHGKVLVLREIGRPPVRIYLNAFTGRPAKVALTEEHPPLGDALVEVAFNDYRNAGPLVLPHSVAITLNGLAVHEETRSSIRIEYAIPDAPLSSAGYEFLLTTSLLFSVVTAVRWVRDPASGAYISARPAQRRTHGSGRDHRPVADGCFPWCQCRSVCNSAVGGLSERGGLESIRRRSTWANVAA